MRSWLKEIREKREIRQLEIAQQCKITQQYYNFIENGRRRPSPEVAQRIAKVLGFDWTLFFVDTEPDEKAG